MASVIERVREGWDAFRNPEATYRRRWREGGHTSSQRPDRPRLNITNERSIIASIYTRIMIDAAKVLIRHVRLDDQDRYLEDINSPLQECLILSANMDQTGSALRRNLYMMMLDRGVMALVPVVTSKDPNETGSYDIYQLRVGEVITWYPSLVTVRLYDEKDGEKKDITLPKAQVAIVENPFYAVMNEPNSTLQRLTKKLNLLDVVDEQSSSGKLDIIIQLPFAVKSETKRQQAKQRRDDLELQMTGSRYGVGYVDATEKITQLNRPTENNLLKQVELLTKMLYGQLGLTEAIMDGTADEEAMLNYFNRTIEPIVSEVADEIKRKFLTKTARTQKQSIEYFYDPFKLIPLSKIAEIADKLTRNEVASSNDIRQLLGWKPSQDPAADELRNKNIPEVDPAPEPTQELPPTKPRLAIESRKE